MQKDTGFGNFGKKVEMTIMVMQKYLNCRLENELYSSNYLNNNKMTTTATKTTLKGGEFLIKETPYQDIFIPEEWTEEQKMIAQTCHDFISQEVNPILDKLIARNRA